MGTTPAKILSFPKDSHGRDFLEVRAPAAVGGSLDPAIETSRASPSGTDDCTYPLSLTFYSRRVADRTSVFLSVSPLALALRRESRSLSLPAEFLVERR